MSSNKYSQACIRCGEVVPAGTGIFETVPESEIRQWYGDRFSIARNRPSFTQHTTCADQYAGSGVHYKFNPATEKTQWKKIRI